MPEAIRSTVIYLSLTFVVIGGYHRIRAAQSKEKIDRTLEGWPILIALRLAGLGTFGSVIAWLWNPSWFEWATVAMPDTARWVGVAWYAFAIAWLIWMFVTLGRNLTDTVVTREAAYFVSHGPYRYVRNPMYLGILMVGLSLGLALGTWFLPLGSITAFSILAMRTSTEEKYLLAKFGDQYRDYMRQVGRFFPRLTAH